MEKKSELLKLIPKQGVLPLYFYKDEEVSVEVLRSLYNAGMRAVEYTNRGEAALQNFKKMRRVCDQELTGMYLGVGTIKSAEMAEIFISEGADFIVSPGFVVEVADVADKSNMLWIPGCMTPSEIIQAENLGASMIKLFPGNLLGPEFMSSIKALFPDLLFMPTGGVNLDKENISAWFKAGVCAVGMGSKLISKKLLEQKDYAKIEALAKEALSIVQSLK
ncbi:MAG: bifunctional 4-hydroxy-2-oxoglutarate aldolase/2-dehydro-3-deoxy-phosphogluconate aldolase [Chitinophagaceae bacterium]|nr:bifunctional 4-hydroxy-2-oxoglutarate aldolase/2-dehydro-3-deoxy-phosphogluconate aldolase [Chitinophagaceae bacterium]